MANIMIVDDEIEILDLIEVYLQNGRHNAIKYNHPAQALENDLSHIDLAVLDVMMPDIDGLFPSAVSFGIRAIPSRSLC